MATAARRHRRTIDIWPGYVDALAALLMVVIFVLLVFVVAQAMLSRTVSMQDLELAALHREIAELTRQLARRAHLGQRRARGGPRRAERGPRSAGDGECDSERGPRRQP
jgi:hypothetical protein